MNEASSIEKDLGNELVTDGFHWIDAICEYENSMV